MKCPALARMLRQRLCFFVFYETHFVVFKSCHKETLNFTNFWDMHDEKKLSGLQRLDCSQQITSNIWSTSQWLKLWCLDWLCVQYCFCSFQLQLGVLASLNQPLQMTCSTYPSPCLHALPCLSPLLLPSVSNHKHTDTLLFSFFFFLRRIGLSFPCSC